MGACLGIPGITAHRAVCGDGSVAGRTILVHGVLGGVGSMAAQLVHRDDARVIGTVTRSSDLRRVPPGVAHAAAAREGALAIPIGDPFPLDQIAEAHDRVDAGTRERVLILVPPPLITPTTSSRTQTGRLPTTLLEESATAAT